jgi:hypothetical protein
VINKSFQRSGDNSFMCHMYACSIGADIRDAEKVYETSRVQPAESRSRVEGVPIDLSMGAGTGTLSRSAQGTSCIPADLDLM